MAIRLEAKGDITPEEIGQTNAAIAWAHAREGNYMQTPILVGDYLYACRTPRPGGGCALNIVLIDVTGHGVPAAMVTAAAQRLLADDSGGRFLLGLGVSHQPMVEGFMGMAYEKPLAAMKGYLDKLDDAFNVSPAPDEEPPRVLAALGPKMLALAAERSWGAHTYFVPPEHTTVAREALGEGPMLLVEQAVFLTDDPDEARAVARRYMSTYLALPNYTNNLRRLGWADEDLAGEGSGKLVDAIVAWGDVDAVVSRVRAHQEAGADHVCLQVLTPDFTAVPMAEWEALAEALL